MSNESKFCEYCGNKVHIDAVMCPSCGRQIEKLKSEKNEPQIVINNKNSIEGVPNMVAKKQCDKWIAFILCLFLGYFGAHKFYEGQAGLGVLYILTLGLFGIGWFIDLIIILCKPNPYYV